MMQRIAWVCQRQLSYLLTLYATNNWSYKLFRRKTKMLIDSSYADLCLLLTVMLLCDVNKPVARMMISVILCEYANMHIT